MAILTFFQSQDFIDTTVKTIQSDIAKMRRLLDKYRDGLPGDKLYFFWHHKPLLEDLMTAMNTHIRQIDEFAQLLYRRRQDRCGRALLKTQERYALWAKAESSRRNQERRDEECRGKQDREMLLYLMKHLERQSRR